MFTYISTFILYTRCLKNKCTVEWRRSHLIKCMCKYEYFKTPHENVRGRSREPSVYKVAVGNPAARSIHLPRLNKISCGTASIFRHMRYTALELTNINKKGWYRRYFQILPHENITWCRSWSGMPFDVTKSREAGLSTTALIETTLAPYIIVAPFCWIKILLQFWSLQIWRDVCFLEINR